jgi:hypothetical protein
MRCNNAEYKKMGQDLSLGQLYDVHKEIKPYTKHWLGLLIYYDNMSFETMETLYYSLTKVTFFCRVPNTIYLAWATLSCKPTTTSWCQCYKPFYDRKFSLFITI